MKSRAFTLVEIVVVVAIIAILATVILVSYGNVVENSKKSKAKGEIQAFLTGIKMMKLDTGEYPGHINSLCNKNITGDTLEEYDVDEEYVGLIKTDGLYKNWNGPYMDQITTDPWGNPYQSDNDYYCGGYKDASGTYEWAVGEMEQACDGVDKGKYVRVIASEHNPDPEGTRGYGGGNVAALICKPPTPPTP